MTAVTLYELSNQLAALLDQIDPETGELPEEYEHARELVINKAGAVAAYVAQRELEADAMAERVKEVERRIKAQRNRCARLREYLLHHMQKTGISEIKSADLLLSVKRYPERDEAVDVFDEKQLPAWAFTHPEPPAPRPDKALLKRCIKDGQEIPGARIVKRDRLEIK